MNILPGLRASEHLARATTHKHIMYQVKIPVQHATSGISPALQLVNTPEQPRLQYRQIAREHLTKATVRHFEQ